MVGQNVSATDFERLFEVWWQVPGVEEIPETVANLNAQARALPLLPVWALQLRAAMPRWGMEMCAHRWLDGLEALIEGIALERYIATPAGCCGHLPASVVAQGEARAMGLEHWLSDDPPRTACESEAADRLGSLEDTKRTAAEGMLALLRARLWDEYPSDAWTTLVAAWRARAVGDPLLGRVLGDHALVDSLENACGFVLLHRIDWALDLIGGNVSHEEKPGQERLGNCNAQLRLLWQYDPDRFAVTRGYLWGLRAWLDDHKAHWLRENMPDCAPAAVYVLNRMDTPTEEVALRRWLARSLLTTTLLWARRAVHLSVEGFAATGAPDWANDLPEPPSLLD